MRFFATQFSTILPGLLIFCSPEEGVCSKQLAMSKIRDEGKGLVMREEVPERDRWNVEALYESIESWKSDLAKHSGVKGVPRWPELAAFKGKLGESKALKKLLDSYLDLHRGLEKLYTYAHLRHDEDLGNDTFKANYGRISCLLHDFSLELSWVGPELLALPQETFEAFLTDQSLKPYRFYLEKIGRQRAHVLPEEQEALIALSEKSLDATQKAFSALNNADLTFAPVLNAKGESFPLSNGSYLSYMKSPDRSLRQSAFINLHRGYKAHINTFCELLQGEVESHLFKTKARGYSSCLDRALFSHNVPKEVYLNLIQAVRSKLPLMHEYIALRKEVMNLSEMHAYDLYVPFLEDSSPHRSYEEAKDAVIASVAPLGKDYQKALRKGLEEDRWVDVYENARKRSGAYSSGCYDSMPYILLNYHGTLSDCLTLAHEAGHSMHSFLSRKNQPYIYAQYPIFVAEVASTFNEQLLLDHLKTNASSPKEKLFLTNYQIEGIRGTIFRQTLFAEFELKLHEWAEAKVPFTPQLLEDAYVQLNKDYYGPDLVIDPELRVEWARIPHFYYGFYVYQYATGLSAAIALFEKQKKDPSSRNGYLEFLSSGGKDFPIALLQKAGVDMKKPDAILSALDSFEALLKEMKEGLKSLKKMDKPK